MIMWGNWTNIGVDSIFKLEKKDGKQMKNKKQKNTSRVQFFEDKETETTNFVCKCTLAVSPTVLWQQKTNKKEV